jgi:hypothetical protein
VAGDTAFAQKSGGILKVYFFDSPASMSIHEEATIAAEGPMMGVFNNLAMYKQDMPQSGFQSIVPDLATDWSWDEDKTQLMFRLREGVKWHDGKPFTSKDVVCTWDLLTGRSSEKLRINPRKAWYRNLEEVVPDGDNEVTFRLKRPQPSEIIRVARNSDYWKKGRPYLDGIEYTIIRNPSTGILAFVAGKVDMTSPFFLQVPLLKDAKRQDPQATCALVPSNVNRNVMMKREAVPVVIALGAASEIFVKRLVRVVEPVARQVQGDGIVAAHDPGEPLRRVDRVEFAIDVDFLQLVDQNDRRIAVGRNIARGHGEFQPFVRPVTQLFHDAAGL